MEVSVGNVSKQNSSILGSTGGTLGGVLMILCLMSLQSVFGQVPAGVQWDRRVVYVPKVTQTGKKVRVKVPFLTLRWQVLSAGEGIGDGSPKETPVDAFSHVFTHDDHVRIRVEANQPGYLYLINHTEDSQGQVTDKTRILNTEGNQITGNRLLEFPTSCETHYQYGGWCWFIMGGQIGKEVQRLIFSRVPIPEFENLTRKDLALSPKAQQKLVELQRKAPVPKHAYWLYLKGSGDNRIRGPQVTMVWNDHVKDNELLIETILLHHR